MEVLPNPESLGQDWVGTDVASRLHALEGRIEALVDLLAAKGPGMALPEAARPPRPNPTLAASVPVAAGEPAALVA